MRLILLTIGTKSQQALELLNWGYSHFTAVTEALAGQFVSKPSVRFRKHKELEIVTGDHLRVLINENQQAKTTTVVNIKDSVEASVKKGQETC
ncbi:hypothetical protein ES754_01495 [Psychrobacter frigidicola]|uniref:Peptidase S11 D-Ala-D-Ala carboxypeptidase A C-terminal domain-containing protein n=1 Tax=Psychrobacter frigidicola TaxID=45611 RepID=A0A5C7A354_9GAMM|nr:hypothetical protein [Psychrobacter frigidicola]TXD97682.1 hypothetical protein ES754_01495 [Psychrobacter frigidicola]